MRIRATTIVLAVAFTLPLSAALQLHPASASRSPGFVSTEGTHLMLGGRIWNMYGGATYGTSNPGAHQSIGDEIDLALQGRLNTLRIVNMFDESGVDPSAPFDAASWARVDQLLAAMQAANLHAILDLSAFRNHLQNRELYLQGTAAVAANYPTPAGCVSVSADAFARCVGASWCNEHLSSCTDPYSNDRSSEWSAFLQFVATRINTSTGVKYSDDPTIALVSFAGEPAPPNSEEPLRPTTQELTDFYARIFDTWKSVDSNHLVTSGGLLHIDWERVYANPSGSGIDHDAIFALPGQDVLSIHNYFAQFPATAATDTKSAEVATAAQAVGKPWITEEFGFKQTPGDGYTETDRANWFRNVYEIQKSPPQGVPSAGVAFWNLGPEVAGESHDVNPRTPATWAVVRKYSPTRGRR